MEASVITLILGGLFGSGGLIAAIIAWRKFPHEKDSTTVEQAKVTAEIALATLTTVNSQYQEVLIQQAELKREVGELKIQFQEQKSLVMKLKDYILHIFDNWESIRHKPNPPKLTTDIQSQIFKDEE